MTGIQRSATTQTALDPTTNLLQHRLTIAATDEDFDGDTSLMDLGFRELGDDPDDAYDTSPALGWRLLLRGDVAQLLFMNTPFFEMPRDEIPPYWWDDVEAAGICAVMFGAEPGRRAIADVVATQA